VDTDASSAGYQPGSVAGPGGTGNCAPAAGEPPLRAGRPSPTGKTSVFSVASPGSDPGALGSGPRDDPGLVTILPGVPDTAGERGGRQPALPPGSGTQIAVPTSAGELVMSAAGVTTTADGALTGR
jgi:hypothetical protein